MLGHRIYTLILVTDILKCLYKVAISSYMVCYLFMKVPAFPQTDHFDIIKLLNLCQFDSLSWCYILTSPPASFSSQDFTDLVPLRKESLQRDTLEPGYDSLHTFTYHPSTHHGPRIPAHKSSPEWVSLSLKGGLPNCLLLGKIGRSGMREKSKR